MENKNINFYTLSLVSGLLAIFLKALLNTYTGLNQIQLISIIIISPIFEEVFKFTSIYLLLLIFKQHSSEQRTYAVSGVVLGFSFGVLEWVLGFPNALWSDRVLATLAHMGWGYFVGRASYFSSFNEWKNAGINLGVAIVCHILWNEVWIFIANWGLIVS
jgi:RsiW-degrading membrane proteinase PrsW (M82 family)